MANISNGIRLNQINKADFEKYFASPNNFHEMISDHMTNDQVSAMISELSDEQKIALDIKYVLPETLPASMIVEDLSRKFVTPSQITTWDNKVSPESLATELLSQTLSANQVIETDSREFVTPEQKTIWTNKATKEEVSSVIAGAPTDLNTLEKIATSIGNNASFADDMTYQLSLKADKTEVEASIKAVVGNVSTDKLDTLAELSKALGDDADFATTVTNTLATKVDKVTGKGLSTEDYTTAEKTKLSGVASGAEVNQNAFSNVVVGSTTVAAESKTDTLTLVAGSNVTITADASTDTVTISSKDTQYGVATTTSAGLQSATDKTKLNGIEAGAEVNQNAFSNVVVGATTIVADAKQDTLTLVAGSNVQITADATNDKVTISATDTTYGVATQSTAGLESAADKTKLDGIEEGANKYTHPSTHAASMITQSASYRFATDTEKATWNAKSRFVYGSSNFKGNGNEVTIAHGIGAKPLNVQITPMANPAGTLGEYWVRYDATNIYVGNTGEATIAFNWLAMVV